MNEDRMLQTLGRQIDRLERVVVRVARLVAIALVVATVLVPIARVVPDGDDPIERYTARELVTVIGEPEKAFLGDDDESAADSAHPVAIPGGLLITRIGLGLLAVGAVGTALSALFLSTSGRRRDQIILRVSAATLLAASLLVATGLGWLPTYRRDDIGPAWGVAVGMLAALWVLCTQLPSEHDEA